MSALPCFSSVAGSALRAGAVGLRLGGFAGPAVRVFFSFRVWSRAVAFARRWPGSWVALAAAGSSGPVWRVSVSVARVGFPVWWVGGFTSSVVWASVGSVLRKLAVAQQRGPVVGTRSAPPVGSALPWPVGPTLGSCRSVFL